MGKFTGITVEHSVLFSSAMAGEHLSASHLGSDECASLNFLCTSCVHNAAFLSSLTPGMELWAEGIHRILRFCFQTDRFPEWLYYLVFPQQYESKG